MSDLERQARERLGSVMDPETGLSIVEMGLVRELHASERGLRLVMTLIASELPSRRGDARPRSRGAAAALSGE